MPQRLWSFGQDGICLILLCHQNFCLQFLVWLVQLLKSQLSKSSKTLVAVKSAFSPGMLITLGIFVIFLIGSRITYAPGCLKTIAIFSSESKAYFLILNFHQTNQVLLSSDEKLFAFARSQQGILHHH